ncbi:hypothetical protein [Chitinophaga flava]|uniref:Uncharacterized protein n=1 Tax=Chitinophaga flava TaxID=2259036 RepID=A0A365XQC4_9BACT|nr:hypothetical protein [Chitinophaga flava]RBL88328.1 hypothetical protein DF182_17185 [Chitinophaga flava]
MQHVKCPNCGATTFTPPVAPSTQREATIDCQYCNSQFTIQNPNYSPSAHSQPVATPAAPPARIAKDWEHKVAILIGKIVGYLMVPFNILLWWNAFTNQGVSSFLAFLFTMIMLGLFFAAQVSSKELARRKKEGITIK